MACLDITVDDALVVQVVERKQNLQHDGPYLALLQALQHDTQPSALLLGGIGKDQHEAWMLQYTQRLSSRRGPPYTAAKLDFIHPHVTSGSWDAHRGVGILHQRLERAARNICAHPGSMSICLGKRQ